jgi:2-polyprenyl-3-methyl-5-hydroxy-6-metoxy-1,4-benzoquinol methylase
MNDFDLKAGTWDQNPIIWERAEAIANEIKRLIPLNKQMTALEFGAGTGVTSFILKDSLKEITLMDNSSEMVKMMDNKIKISGVKNLKTLNFNLERSDLENEKFDFIFNQMVLHHIDDVEKIIKKFHNLINPGGYLAIADLYAEDGSFHGVGFTGHNGFDIEKLSSWIKKQGFTGISHRKCYTINKKISETVTQPFDVFLIIAQRP